MKGAVLAAILSCAVLLTVEGQTPEKCCIRYDKWSAYMTDLSTLNSKALTVSLMQIDYVNHMQVVTNMTYDPVSGSKINGRVVYDYPKKIMYYIPPNDPKTCIKTPSAFQEIRCIPKDAVYMGSSYLGPMAGSMNYDGWRFKAAGNITITLAVTKDCVPLVEGVAIPGLMPPFNNQMYLFTTNQPKLVDPTQFVLPDSCK